jgi:ribonuclease HI
MKRTEITNYYINNLSDGKINNMRYKKRLIGEGGQGDVYLLEFENDIEIVRKKTYINKDIKRYIKPENMYIKRALENDQFIEIVANQLYSNIVLSGINKHFLISYETIIKERGRICKEDFPYKVYNYIEYIRGIELIDYIGNEELDIERSKIIMYQIVSGLYTMRKYFTMKHMDLHSHNIMIELGNEQKNKYIIENEEYIINDRGNRIYILDMGHCYEKNKMLTRYIKNKYTKNEIENDPVIDIRILKKDLEDKKLKYKQLEITKLINEIEDVIEIGYLEYLKKVGNNLNIKASNWETINNMDKEIEGLDKNLLEYTRKGNRLIFTDGASKGNGKGRAGFGVYVEEYPNLNIVGEMEIGTTNNTAELTAVFNAYKIIRDNYKRFIGHKILIISDSEYTIKSITEWCINWEKNGWMNVKKQPVKNKDLIKSILELKKECEKLGLNIWIKHINSHRKEPDDKDSYEWRLWNGNDIVDKMINELIN